MLDVSGSMRGEPWSYLMESVKQFMIELESDSEL